MNTQEIINQDWKKTKKIQELILLGLTRREIADLVCNGNYGFAQNVYAKMLAEGKLNALAIANFNPLPFTKRFGVEFEAYNVLPSKIVRELQSEGIECYDESYNHSTRPHWKVVSDASIVGQNSFELVSPILEGENGLEQVKTVCRVLKKCNAYINKSCGMHVHFDAQNFDLNQWKNIYKNYAGFENQIDELMPASRRANNAYYCKSLKINNLETKIDNARNLSEIERVFQNNRYFKINPKSYARHNTIEFRQHSGTVEFEKVSNWILFLHNLVDYSKNHFATDFSWSGLEKINQENIITYYHNRKQELAA